ncbi:MAG: GGDEF domain-containing protein [Shewanella sp.]
MSQESLQIAAQNLKKAVPLMLKHRIPTTPTNYALWYAYVDEQLPELNQHLDTLVAQYNTCPPINSELLYRQYIADSVELDVREMRQNLDAMVCELSQSLKDTQADTTQFQSRFEHNLAKLNRIEDEGVTIEQVLDLVSNLVKESDHIRANTVFFSEQLQRAQTEIDALKHKLQQTEKDVLYDALTGCLNRRAFDDDFSGVLSQAPEGCCIILADIDHFKVFNDSYGHQLGDQVLRAVAKRLQEFCREGCKLYRFGGEEFVIIIPKSQLRIARQLAESMRRGIEKLTLKDRKSDKRVDHISASFGVAQWQAKQTSIQLIEQADKLLYEAKRLGRNRVMPING